MIKENILISLEPRHAQNILDGIKRVELRRRRMHIAPGTIVWIYSKLPEGSVVGCATVDDVQAAALSTIWRKHGSVSGITRAEFFGYFAGGEQAFALILSRVKKLKNPVSLKDLRGAENGFNPPQFFRRLSQDEKILEAVASAI